MRYIITKTDPFKKYFGMGGMDPAMYCRDLYTLFDISCIEIAEPLLDSLYPILPIGYEEVTKDEALYGSTFFSEIRDKIKIINPASPMAETTAMPETEKIQIDMTGEMRQHIVTFMYRFAKELIEDEFNYRFKDISKTNDIETASWQIQKHEAQEWLTYQGADGHTTRFLDYLAQEHNVDKTELANKILQKAEEYEDRLSDMLVVQQKLIKQFKNAQTVKDMNVLYEKYFGIMMPIQQAQELGLSDEWGNRIFYNDNGDKMYEIVNPYMGHKFNF
jgi:hypothetical protein